MTVRKFIIFLVASAMIACGRNPEIDRRALEIQEVSLYDIVDDVEPPPPHISSNFKTLQGWLLGICDGKKPEKSIAKYHFGLFQSSNANTMYLVGVNTYHKGDTSYARIEFRPSDMYFQLPNSEYKNSRRDELLKKLTVQLKAFTIAEKFKNSFLSKANAMVFEPNGQTIWSK